MVINRIKRFWLLSLLTAFVSVVLVFSACTDENNNSSTSSPLENSSVTSLSDSVGSRSLTREEQDSYISKALSLLDDLDSGD